VWGAETNAPAPVVRQIRDILSMSTEEVRQRHPVAVQAVVTLFYPSYGLWFVQDQTGGIFVTAKSVPSALKPGDGLNLGGSTMAGLFSPILYATSVQKTGPQPMPVPRPLSLGQAISGQWDSQYAELAGMVRGAKALDAYWLIDLADGLNQVRVWIPQAGAPAPPDWVEAQVRVRGVVGLAFDRQQQLTGVNVYVSRPEDVSVLSAPGRGPFARPVTACAKLLSYRPWEAAAERLRVQGVVTFAGPGCPVVLQDATGAVVLEVAPAGQLSVGDRIDAAGFLVPELRERRLAQVLWKPLAPGAPPAPRPVELPELLAGQHRPELVATEGRLLSAPFLNSQGLIFLLHEKGRVLSAVLPGTNAPPRPLPPESQVRLTGVAGVEPGVGPRAAAVQFWLRSPADVLVLGSPVPRGRGGLFWWLGGGLAAALGGAGFGLVQWRRQRLKLGRLEQQHAALAMEYRESAAQFQRSQDERERIAQDLHDDIIQSIYAVGWRLDECRRQAASAPEQAESRLAQAIAALNDIIRQVRQVIAGLEPKALNGREFKTALKSLALTASDNQSPVVIQVDPAAANLLTSHEATHLLHIAKEAMSNSWRHAQARNLQVALHLAGGEVRLEISDDGVGFDPAGDFAGHGLRNMAGRARTMGARFDVLSRPGQGTRLVLALPQRVAP
jgi:signal transduction histidine kinase